MLRLVLRSDKAIHYAVGYRGVGHGHEGIPGKCTRAWGIPGNRHRPLAMLLWSSRGVGRKGRAASHPGGDVRS